MELRYDGARGVVTPVRLAADRQLLAVVLVLTAVRLLAGGVIHLTEDEAYYRLWAQHLQAGYLDHPPMIAWWIRLGQLAAGDTPLGVRLVPALATGGATWLVGDLARRLGLAERTAARAALWYNATFTVGVGGLLATPDTPACFFWTLTLWCLARACAGRNGLWWLAAGFSAGLSCLSKYSGLFLAPGVLLWLLVTPGGLAQLKRPWPWLAALLAAAVFAPNVLWNAAHGWMTFDKQFGRVAADALRPERLPEFLATQFLLLNPLIAVQAARGAARAWAARRDHAAPAVLAPLAAAAPFALYLAIHSLHDRVQGHWPAPAISAIVLAAAFAAEQSRPWLRRATPILGLGLSAAALLYLALPRLGAVDALDPTQAVRHWPEFARQIESLRQAQGAGWVGTESYGLTAQLAGEPELRAPVVQLIERERYFRWQEALDLTGPGLVVDLGRRLNPAELGRCFAKVQPVATLARGPDRGPRRRYAAYRVAEPRRDVLRLGCPSAKAGN